MSDPTTKPATAARTGRLEVDQTREKMVEQGLLTAAEELTSELSEAVAHNRTAHQVLAAWFLTLEKRRVGKNTGSDGPAHGPSLPDAAA
jgi:hypothetical protein